MMAIVPGYKNDVFLSYSHGPKGGNRLLREWSRKLIKRLRSELRAIDPDFRKRLVIWTDMNIDEDASADFLNTELKANVTQSAILLVVMSPLYLESHWCRSEATWFRSVVSDLSGRVFVVRAVSTDESTWPDWLGDERGFIPGFYLHPRGGPPGAEPFGWPDSIENDERIGPEIARLRTVLLRRLRDMKKEIDAAVPADDPPTSR